MDSSEPRMRHGAAHESDLLRTGEMKIADVLALPSQEPLILLAPHRSADAMVLGRCGMVVYHARVLAAP